MAAAARTLRLVLEWAVALMLLGCAAAVLGFRQRGAVLAVALMLLAFCAAALGLGRRTAAPAAPLELAAPGFATSNACRACHPGEHESWHASFHRSMTQTASTEHVASDVLKGGGRLRVETGGRSVELFGRGRELFASLPDPTLTSLSSAADYERAFALAPSVEARIELLTGSHRQQVFWVRSAREGELVAVPVAYLIRERRLIPRRDAFLNPPQAPERAVRWNSNCIQCHSVAGAPRHDPLRDTFASSAAELGIACEACHGAAAEHVARMQNPLRRYFARWDSQAAASEEIVNPARLTAERSSEVCGRCHAYFYPQDEAEWWTHGFSRSFRPGSELSRAQLLLQAASLSAARAPRLDQELESLFYADGTIRVGGREYNGLVLSPCYERGRGKRRLACTSCHSLHDSAPADQLGHGMDGNAACLQCHQSLQQDVSAHTRHAPDSPGSLCYNCHMPQVTYALLGATRSHRIDVPSFSASTRDRPNACSLCHLERSPAWAAEHARRRHPALPTLAVNDLPDVPAAALFALTGDAAVRAITAAALGRRDGVSGSLELRHQLLEELTGDDYAAVRFIAAESRARLPPANADGSKLDAALVAELRRRRDERPVTIAE